MKKRTATETRMQKLSHFRKINGSLIYQKNIHGMKDTSKETLFIQAHCHHYDWRRFIGATVEAAIIVLCRHVNWLLLRFLFYHLSVGETTFNHSLTLHSLSTRQIIKTFFTDRSFLLLLFSPCVCMCVTLSSQQTVVLVNVGVITPNANLLDIILKKTNSNGFLTNLLP